MPEYLYVARDGAGKQVEGRVEAENEGELRMVLRSKGLRPIKIAKPGIANQDLGTVVGSLLGRSRTVPQERLMIFIKQLHTMISSGVPLVQAIELFHDQESHPYLKEILGSCRDRINSGSFLWECFAAYPDVFERVFVALVRAGESSGTLDVMLKRTGKYLENSYRLKKLIRSSMNYPIIVLSIATGVVTLMLGLVIPKFEEMLTSTGGELPGPTKLVIALSHGLVEHFGAIAVIVLALGYVARSYAKSEEGAIVLQKTALGLPLFGNLVMLSGVARFARTVSTLLSAGIPLIDTLEISRSASSNIAFENAIANMKKEVELGSSFGNAMLRQGGLFPKMALQMTVVGENTGNLDKMLDRVADFYEEEVETSIQGMLKLVEPLMLVLLGGVVGGLLIAMYLPVFQMAGGVQ